MQNVFTQSGGISVVLLSALAGRALVEVGESYKQLAEVKYSMEDTVKQNFLEPLQSLQNKDLKEVNVCIHSHSQLLFTDHISEEVMQSPPSICPSLHPSDLSIHLFVSTVSLKWNRLIVDLELLRVSSHDHSLQRIED